MQPRRRRTRILLVATFLIFFVPIVGAWLLNLFAPGWRPFGSVNHGTLVQPVRALSTAGLTRADGGPVYPGALSGRWTIVHVQDGPCRAPCEAALAHTRQVQRALGDDMNRVQRLVVLTAAAHAPSAGAAADALPAVAGKEWLSSFSFAGADFEAGIYLVDPQGYLMMRYPLDVDQRGLLADLERLLKISKIG